MRLRFHLFRLGGGRHLVVSGQDGALRRERRHLLLASRRRAWGGFSRQILLAGLGDRSVGYGISSHVCMCVYMYAWYAICGVFYSHLLAGVDQSLLRGQDALFFLDALLDVLDLR